MKFHAFCLRSALLFAVLNSNTSCTSAFSLAPVTSSSSTSVSAASVAAVSNSRRRTGTALEMAQQRGLEVRQEGASPTEGGMTLYCKAGPDGTLVGDCPFAHYVRLVLEERGLEYDIVPTVPETKPVWLIEHYQGKMPALRHRKEAYVESDVICEYLEFFFPVEQKSMSKKAQKEATEEAENAVAGLFPSIAKYLKHTPDGDADDEELKSELQEKLTLLETHLENSNNKLFMVGEQVSLQDCSLAPKLYHLQSGLEAFKGKAIDLPGQYPAVQAYMDAFFARESFQKTVYPKETVAWGWGNARK